MVTSPFLKENKATIPRNLCFIGWEKLGVRIYFITLLGNEALKLEVGIYLSFSETLFERERREIIDGLIGEIKILWCSDILFANSEAQKRGCRSRARIAVPLGL